MIQPDATTNYYPRQQQPTEPTTYYISSKQEQRAERENPPLRNRVARNSRLDLQFGLEYL
eukprot:scaffold31724_cov60-Cyclotella_meneghiniana.AAC.3